MSKQARVVGRNSETEWMPFRKAARMFLTLSGLWGQANQWRLEVRG